MDLRDATPAADFVTPKVAGGVVESIKVEELDELGKRITRLSIAHKAEAKVDVRSVGQGLAVAVVLTAIRIVPPVARKSRLSRVVTA